MSSRSKTKTNTIYDPRQIRRWNHISSHVQIAGEHKRSLEKEIERTSGLLMAYFYKLGAQETAKADELSVLHWSKLVPSVYPGIISNIAELNKLLAKAVEDVTLQTSEAQVHDE